MKATWSVMIPTYHCNEFLPQCLRSVLMQDLGPEQMQIAVVNDDPNDDECAKLVEALAPGRVAYHRNERNLGADANFNRCIDLATGDLLLILHGDDYLKAHFFEKLSALAESCPAAGMIACRGEGVDGDSIVNWVSHRYREFESLSFDESPIWESLHLMPGAVVVRREVYGRVGGFRPLVFQDWEMWFRIIRAAGIIMTPEVLSAYRQHGDSITGRTRRSAENIRELDEVYKIFAANQPRYPLTKMRRNIGGTAHGQAMEYKRRGDTEAAAANFRAWREITPFPSRLVTHSKRCVKTLLGRG
jgi:glycosyltransferase involved in cell wall biosynthesis